VSLSVLPNCKINELQNQNMKPSRKHLFSPCSVLSRIVFYLLLGFASGANAQARDHALYASALAEQSAVLATLERLVNIETGTGDAKGLAEMGQLLESELRAVGAEVERHPALAGVVGDNIVGTLKGSGTRKILLMAHMDTVYPRGTLAKAPLRIAGNLATTLNEDGAASSSLA
jgi:hypothetical protein